MKVKTVKLSKAEKYAVVYETGIISKVQGYGILTKDHSKGIVVKAITDDCVIEKHHNDYIERLKVSKNEAVEIVFDILNSGKWIDCTLEEAFKKRFLCFHQLPQEFRAEEVIHAALKDDIQTLRYIDVNDEIVKEGIEYHPGANLEYFFNEEKAMKLSTEMYAVLIRENINNAKIVPKERWTKNLLYLFLELMVHSKSPYGPNTIGDPNYSVINIPNELKDKVYYQSYCMVNGYNFKVVPDEYKKYVFTSKLINYCMSHDKSYVGILHMIEAIPEVLKTWDVCLGVCVSHFYSFRSIPLRFKTDEFYMEVYRMGQKNFEQADFSKLSDDAEILKQDIKFPTDKKVKKLADKKEIVLASVKRPGGSGDFKDYVTKTYLHNREIIEAFLTVHGASIDTVDETDLDEDLCLTAMRSNSYALSKGKKIPERFRTDSFWEKVLAENLEYKLMIPTKYITEEMIENKILSGEIELVDIPEELQTEKHAWLYAKKVVQNNKSLCAAQWNSFGKWQSINICKYVLEGIMEKENGLYMACISLYGCEYVDEALIWKILPEYNCIKSVENPTEEMLNFVLHQYPNSILTMPEWYVQKVRDTEGVRGETEEEVEEPEVSDDEEYEESENNCEVDEPITEKSKDKKTSLESGERDDIKEKNLVDNVLQYIPLGKNDIDGQISMFDLFAM